MASEGKSNFTAPTTYLVCLIHLVISIVLIACTTPGDEPINLGGVLIYPQLQWANSAFCCLSIVSIIVAGVGNLYHIESHLAAYFYLLLVSVAVDLFWLVIFIVFGQSCSTHERTVADSKTTQAMVYCTFGAGGAVVLCTLLALFKVFAMVTVSRAQTLVRIQYNAELLPHLKQSLSQSLGSMATMPHLAGRSMGGGEALPMQAEGYGSLTQRSATMQKSGPVSDSVVSAVPRISMGPAPASSPASMPAAPVPSSLKPTSMQTRGYATVA
mmetsp:Transcript_56300/g.121307  ORF Transcript_56300/g.121307 Transcript_56300/m.121307 type:complete len:270 (+) Transcript_56300:164-973(+)